MTADASHNAEKVRHISDLAGPIGPENEMCWRLVKVGAMQPVCPICGAMIPWDSTGFHAKWHAHNPSYGRGAGE